MPRVYELPTHLQVEDTLIVGLTARQLLRLLVGASLAYALWDQTITLPTLPRLGLSVGLALFGLLLALVQPGGRPLDQWLLAAALFLLLPRRRVWRRTPPDRRIDPQHDDHEWAELALQPDWVTTRPVTMGAPPSNESARRSRP
jgi:PrgI family protein